MSYGYFSKYDREVVRVFRIREHHAKIVKLGRYDLAVTMIISCLFVDTLNLFMLLFVQNYNIYICSWKVIVGTLT